MSLKAKIEAVIYASEEPVTLAQLVSLLGEEGQAELDARASQQTALALEDSESGDADALNAECLTEPGEALEDVPEVTGSDITSAPAPETAEAEAPQAETSEAATPEPAPEAPAPEASEADAKFAAKDAKLRERALRDHFRFILDRLIADYASDDRGLEVREVAGGYRLATKPEYHDAVRGFVKSLKPPLKLSLQALETLAVVAYKQPVTSPEISEIRGVDSGGVLGGLMARKLITTAGRKQVIGRPILYKTTKDFLVRFGLKDINELPSIEEFEKMAGELADADPVQEEIPMEQHPSDSTEEDSTEDAAAESTHPEVSADEAATERAAEVEPMRDVHEAQADGTPGDSSAPAIDSPEIESELDGKVGGA